MTRGGLGGWATLDAVFAQARICVALALALGACVPPAPGNDVVADYDESTAMGSIQAAGVIRIGLEADAFPLGAKGRDPRGLTFEIGTELAESLGVDADFVAAPRDALVRMIDSGELDAAFPLTPITEPAVEKHAFSDPWWVGHQRLLVTTDGVDGVADLKGARVCDAPDRATGIPIAELASDIADAVAVDDPRRCRRPLRRGRLEAVSGPDALLVAVLAAVPEARITGEQHTTAGYGAMTSKDSVGLSGFVDAVLAEIDSEGRWERWYEEYVTPLTGEPPPGAPTMTIEEAAALYPK